ncbi:hypothetical protein SDRG_12896 [Saprolegnia diclina VS20]|uniref:Apple domain-containing protein n=1 Tax=Saprolegnia diclina (strain VS20) TaxID=1156394 RepID=T0PVB2_SAPDV|nr:hypothetical protein SDRG_12896 [Saprolegnia diclina VS20]EQC29434.1 hypothetical protein SDRG_12896 [Saprolegnia diclina VS20]|eukprot:XP_008617201.1 hypothetical protein SDRG_12896 [Saprolegnia diclina VS20]
MGNHISSTTLIVVAFVVHVAVGEAYDVIIIGSGPGGLVAAEYLSRNASTSVLVLEAGGPSLAATGGTDIPGYAQSQGLTRFDVPGEYSNVAFQSDNKYRMGTDWVASPTGLYLGKVVGGSSSLNGMLYFRTPNSYVTEASWPNDVATVDAGFSAIETMFTSTNNPSPDGSRYLQEAYNIMRNVLGGGGYTESNSLNTDRNAKSKSYGHPPFAIKNGLRDSPAKTFLGAAKTRPNFKLISSATVSYIIQSKGVATGVVYTTNGQTVTVDLSSRGAVVVAGSAVMTPKILMQSGVGPSSQLTLLKANGNFPGVSSDAANWVVNENVGSSLFDTHQLLMTFSRKDMKTFAHTQSPTAAITQYMTQGHSGPWSSPDPVQIAYDNYNVNGRAYQFQVTTFCHGFNWGSNNPTEFGVAVYVNNPISRDSARFTSDGRYHLDTARSMYSDQRDRAALANYVEKLRGMMSAQGVTTVIPAKDVASTDFVNKKVEGANHYGGSCYTSGDKTDSKRCADETFLVVGAKNIYVGDGSLMKEGTVNPYGFIMYAGHQTGVNVAKTIVGYSEVTPPTSPPTLATCTDFENDVDYYGNDIGATSRASADACCADCAAKPGCTLYVWNKHNGGTCWLKNARGAKSTQLGAKSGSMGATTPAPTTAPVVTPTPTPVVTPTPIPGGDVSCSAVENDVDYAGNDIGSTARSSVDACCADCAAKPGCSVYVWTNYNGGMCWLKSGRGPKSTQSGAKAGSIDASASGCGIPEPNTDFAGQDVGNVPGTNPGDCCAACKKNKACNAYSLWNNICWLKSGHNGRKAAPGTTAAVVNKCSALEIGTDYVGSDIGSAAASTADDCCAKCRNMNGCGAFSWYQGTCYFKSSKSATKANGNVISATVLM